jgi:hypothetical protein
MSRYDDWGTIAADERGKIAKGRLTDNLVKRYPGLSTYAQDEAVAAALTEFTATTPEVFNAKAFGAKGDGVTNDTTAIQAAIDVAEAAGAGTVYCPVGTYMTDTLYLVDDVTIEGAGSLSVLKLIPHTKTHNPILRLGTPTTDTAATATKSAILGRGTAHRAKVRNLKLDGNSAAQTGPSDEWSHAIWIWNASGCTVERVEIADPAGDGVLIGYDTPLLVGSHGNNVVNCEIYSVARQGIAITWGNENNIIYNRVSDSIDLEINPNIGECKANLVMGNRGNVGGGVVTSPLTSNLFISLASTNAVNTRYHGNRVIGNHCYQIKGQYNLGTVVQGNFVVGSNAVQTNLVDLIVFDDAVITGNIFVANTTVATALTEIVRTQAGVNTIIAHNIANNETIPFYYYDKNFGVSPDADNNCVKDNIIIGSGDYATGDSRSELTEQSTFKLEMDGGTPQVFTWTHLSGPKISPSVAAAGTIGRFELGYASAESLWMIEIGPYGETGANSEPYDEAVIHTVDVTGATRDVNVYMATLAADPTWAAIDFSDGGTQATMFVTFRY